MTRFILVLTALLALTPFAHAADTGEEAARKAVLSLVPQAQIDAIEKSPIEGYYQVVMGGQVVYVSNDGRYLMQGTLFDVANRLDLTSARQAKQHVAKLKAYPMDKHLVFGPAKPKYKITVFTDLDCGYCRKMHSHMAEYNARGIEVDYLFFPRSGPGTPSFDKAVSVWCAKDRNAALTAGKSGVDPAPLKCDNPIAEQFQLGVEVGVDGTPAVYTEDGSKIGGYLTPDQLIAHLERMAATAKSGG